MRMLSLEDVEFVKSILIHQDADIMAFNKPSGLSSQGGRINAATLDDMMQAFEKASGNRPRLVHRLDRDTSGVILTARTKPAAGFLGREMMGRRIRKTYLAIVASAPKPPQGTIKQALKREEIGRESYMRTCSLDDPDAQEARTLYRTLASNDEAALLEMRPQTGRMHQIRVHLQSIGRPIAGDARYGGPLMLGGHPVPRLMLHAYALEFPHPAGGVKRIEANPPEDFMGLVAALGLDWNANASPVIQTIETRRRVPELDD